MATPSTPPPAPAPAPEPPMPSLGMRLDRLDALPPLTIPAGYELRTFRAGDAAAWESVIEESFRQRYIFNVLMRPDAAYRPERVLMIWRGDLLVATAAAWFRPALGHDVGYLHMVGARPSESGRGLGRAICLACMHDMRRQGRTSAYLHTDGFRLPAIRIYIDLGFAPVLRDERHRRVWPDTLTKLGREDLIARWAGILNGPVASTPSDPPDMDSPDRFDRRTRWHTRPHKGGLRGGGDLDFRGDESLYPPRGVGAATLAPARVRAGAPLDAPLTVRFTVGADGLRAGAKVLLVVRGQGPLGFAAPKDGRGPGGFRLVAPPGCTLEPAFMGFRVAAGEVAPGQVVEMIIDPAPGLNWNPVAGRRIFKLVVEPGPDEPQRRLPEALHLDIEPGPLDRLEVLMPCTRAPGAPIELQVAARDALDNRVPLDAPVGVEIAGRREVVHLARGLGRCVVTAPGDAPLHAAASIDGRQASCRSNVSVVEPGMNFYVGDLHLHDLLSQAEGYPDEVYRWAMEDRRFDFLSLAAQSHGYHSDETWTLHKYFNERFLDEGRFVTLLGFEWQHSHFGDKVVHFLGGDQPYLPVDDARYDTPAKLYEALRGSDATVISHHPAYPAGWVPGCEYSAVETDVERVIEIWSMHGSSEGYDPADRPLTKIDPERYVMAALRRGVRLGFVAGSDTHSGRPGGSAREPRPHWGGCAGLWAPSLTRRDILAAIQARRTVALTGARILLRMTVNGAWMGAELPPAQRASVKIDVWAPSPIRRVELMKNTAVHRVIAPDAGDARQCHVEIDDPTGGSAFYHCRVTLEDGQLAVCSPVWIG